MKKAIFAVLVALLAMLAVTCDGVVLPLNSTAEPGKVIPDEPGTVTLGISIGNTAGRARALVGASSQTAANFYEVVFVAPNTTNVYRQTHNTTTDKNGNGGDGFNMTVAVGNYTNAGGAFGIAVIFAGYDDGTDKTLLGVGHITATVDGTGTPPATEITENTTSVVFSIVPLVTGVDPNVEETHFHITSNANGVTPTPTGSATLPLLTIAAGETAPMYALPGGTAAITGITASWVFTLSDTTDAKYVRLTSAAPAMVTSAAFINPHENTEPGQIVTVTAIAQNATTATPIVADTTTLKNIIDNDGFKITFNTLALGTGVPGAFSTLAISVPVKLVIDGAGTLRPNPASTGGGSSGTVAAVTDWHLKGGLDNTKLDDGAGGEGGRVLLKIGEPTVSDDTVDIEITPDW